jgi:hypothetical protein
VQFYACIFFVEFFGLTFQVIFAKLIGSLKEAATAKPHRFNLFATSASYQTIEDIPGPS